MDTQLIITAVEFIASVVEGIDSSTQVAKVITLLESWLPTIINEVSSLVPIVQGIISTLKGSAQLTSDQVAAVDALNAQCDAAFDAAASDATD